jgi:hypothetical protein
MDLVFLWFKRENKEYGQYKHEKQGKNNIFIEFFQLVKKGVWFLGQQGMRKHGRGVGQGNKF